MRGFNSPEIANKLLHPPWNLAKELDDRLYEGVRTYNLFSVRCKTDERIVEIDLPVC